MRILLALLASACVAAQTQPFAGTAPLTMQGDLAAQMVEGIARYLQRETTAQVPKRAPSRDRLRQILGVVDDRIPFRALDLMATSDEPALLASTPSYRVYAVRWPVLSGMTAEGLWFQPAGKALARVVAIPDADQLPENFDTSRKLAAAGCEVLSPV